MPAADATGDARPGTALELFLAFNGLALQGFGGVLAVAQRELVERKRWLSRDAFLELVSAAQVLPGPNIVNLALMLGDRYFGLRGALAALAGMLALPLVIVLVLASLYSQYAQWPMVSGALRGMGAVAAGLIIATACKLLPALRSNPLGLALSIMFLLITLLGMGWLRWPLVWVVCGLGTVSVALAWSKLKP